MYFIFLIFLLLEKLNSTFFEINFNTIGVRLFVLSVILIIFVTISHYLLSRPHVSSRHSLVFIMFINCTLYYGMIFPLIVFEYCCHLIFKFLFMMASCVDTHICLKRVFPLSSEGLDKSKVPPFFFGIKRQNLCIQATASTHLMSTHWLSWRFQMQR